MSVLDAESTALAEYGITKEQKARIDKAFETVQSRQNAELRSRYGLADGTNPDMGSAVMEMEGKPVDAGEMDGDDHNRPVEGVARIPTRIQSCYQRGVEFNSRVERLAVGLEPLDVQAHDEYLARMYDIKLNPKVEERNGQYERAAYDYFGGAEFIIPENPERGRKLQRKGGNDFNPTVEEILHESEKEYVKRGMKPSEFERHIRKVLHFDYRSPRRAKHLQERGVDIENDVPGKNWTHEMVMDWLDMKNLTVADSYRTGKQNMSATLNAVYKSALAGGVLSQPQIDAQKEADADA